MREELRGDERGCFWSASPDMVPIDSAEEGVLLDVLDGVSPDAVVSVTTESGEQGPTVCLVTLGYSDNSSDHDPLPLMTSQSKQQCFPQWPK